MNESTETPAQNPLNRRQVLGSLVVAGAVATLGDLRAPADEPARERAVVHGRIRQSIVFWCFNIAGEKWDLDKTCQVTRDLGVDAVEIVAPQDWGILKKYGLKCVLS